MVERVDIVSLACSLLGDGDVRGAIRLLVDGYPLERVEAAERAYSATEALRVFRRDGFVDRYSGSRLLFPGVLRVLSTHLPTVFPYHPNWKISEIHFAYWELFPAVDPVRPLARGGIDEEANWVTTSMLRKSAKASWTLEELGWTLHPPGDLAEWDGLQSWFVAYVERTPKLGENRAIRGWYQAAVGAEPVRS